MRFPFEFGRYTRLFFLLALAGPGDDLEKNGSQGARQEEGGAYYRFLRDVDVSQDEPKQTIISLVDLFNKQNLRVAVDPKPEPDSPVSSFTDELAELPALFFV